MQTITQAVPRGFAGLLEGDILLLVIARLPEHPQILSMVRNNAVAVDGAPEHPHAVVVV